MADRLSEMRYVDQAARQALKTGHAYAVVQKPVKTGVDLVFPSVVYYGISQDTITTLEGSWPRAVALRVESRAKGDMGYRDATMLDVDVIRFLRMGGRLRALVAMVDDYEEELNVYRRIRTVMIKN